MALKRIITTTYFLFLQKLSPRFFTLFYNLFQMTIGTESRLHYSNDLFHLRDAELKIHDWKIARSSRVLQGYFWGAQQRVSRLRNDYFLDQIQLEPGDLVVDCGANIGDFWMAMKASQSKFDYMAFEPSLEEFTLLTENVEGGELYNYALGNENNLVEFYESKENANSSLVEPPNYESKTIVRSVRLSDYVDRRVKLLKLESEGTELEVLWGSLEKLKDIEYITADVGPERGLFQETTLPEVTNLLLSHGFSVTRFSNERVTMLFRNNLVQTEGQK